MVKTTVKKRTSIKFSSIKKGRGHHISQEDREEIRLRLKQMKDDDAGKKAEKIRILQEKKDRRAENLRRREENAKKAEIVVKLTNSAKLKRMAKKQLKRLKKV